MGIYGNSPHRLLCISEVNAWENLSLSCTPSSWKAQRGEEKFCGQTLTDWEEYKEKKNTQ